MMFNITSKRFWFFLLSGIIILIGIISLVTFGLEAGIEFGSGSMTTVNFADEVDQGQLRQELASLGYTNAIVQRTGEGDYLIRTRELGVEEKTDLEDDLVVRFGSLEETEFHSVSPIVATETARNAGIAVAVSRAGLEEQLFVGRGPFHLVVDRAIQQARRLLPGGREIAAQARGVREQMFYLYLLGK